MCIRDSDEQKQNTGVFADGGESLDTLPQSGALSRIDRIQQIEDMLKHYYKCYGLQPQDGWRDSQCLDDIVTLLRQGVAQAMEKQRSQKLEPWQLSGFYRQTIVQVNNKLLEAQAIDKAAMSSFDESASSHSSVKKRFLSEAFAAGRKQMKPCSELFAFELPSWFTPGGIDGQPEEAVGTSDWGESSIDE